jgi:hypothetical protein
VRWFAGAPSSEVCVDLYCSGSLCGGSWVSFLSCFGFAFLCGGATGVLSPVVVLMRWRGEVTWWWCFNAAGGRVGYVVVFGSHVFPFRVLAEVVKVFCCTRSESWR